MRDLVLNATISSFEAMLILFETIRIEIIKIAISRGTIHFDLEIFLIITSSQCMFLIALLSMSLLSIVEIILIA